jgi:hypothetical protein
MCIRIVQQPAVKVVDGVPLDRFEPGGVYEVGTNIGALLLAEGWAVPASPHETPAEPGGRLPSLLGADSSKPIVESKALSRAPRATAADSMRRRKRHKKSRKKQ